MTEGERPYQRTKRILDLDRQREADAAHKKILDVVTEDGTDEEKVAKMTSLADIAYRLLARTSIYKNKPKK